MLNWPWTAMCHVWWELPVNVDILLLVGLPPQPFTLYVWVWVSFVKSADNNIHELKVLIGCCFMWQMIHHFSIICRYKLVPVQILYQSLYCFSFRVSDLLNKTQVTPWKNLGSKRRKPSVSCLVSYGCYLLNTYSRVPLVESPWPSCCSPWIHQSSEHWKRRFSGKMRCSTQTTP